jgi:N,N'-diacetyllegionaminate synthase
MTYIIAEAGSVPDGSVGSAMKLLEHCAAVGADAFKLQCHKGERIKGNPPWFQGHESRAEYLERTGLTRNEWRIIRERCTELGVDLVVSPFSCEAVALLEELPVDAYKVASGQVTNLPMLEAIGKTGRRVILSSGMTSKDELITASAMFRPLGPWAILQCTSEYVCTPERVGLNVVRDWVKHAGAWSGEIGLSDHTLGFAASLAAIALGATVIERHVCFDRRGYGTDCAHSLTLDEFARFVKEVRDLDVMLASPVDKDALCATPEMQKMREAFLERPE